MIERSPVFPNVFWESDLMKNLNIDLFQYWYHLLNFTVDEKVRRTHNLRMIMDHK